MSSKGEQAVSRRRIVEYLLESLDRADLSEEEFNHRLQRVGIEPPSESARIGSRAHGIPLSVEDKGPGIE